jgi:hypothetical protein
MASRFQSRLFEDPITGKRVGRSRGVKLDGTMYNARSMANAVNRGSAQVPHSRRRLSNGEMSDIRWRAQTLPKPLAKSTSVTHGATLRPLVAALVQCLVYEGDLPRFGWKGGADWSEKSVKVADMRFRVLHGTADDKTIVSLVNGRNETVKAVIRPTGSQRPSLSVRLAASREKHIVEQAARLAIDIQRQETGDVIPVRFGTM